MLFHLDCGTATEADTSAMGAINRPLQVSGLMCIILPNVNLITSIRYYVALTNKAYSIIIEKCNVHANE